MTRRDIFKIFSGAGAAGAALPAVKSVETLQVDKDECIVVTLDGRPNWQALDNLRDTFKNGLNGRFKDTPVLLLADGAHIQVLKKK